MAAEPSRSTKHRLSPGAWIGIGAGALALVALLIVTLVMIVPGNPVADDGAGEGDEASSAEPMRTVTLDDSLEFAAGPFWSQPLNTAGWAPNYLFRDGVSQFSLPGQACYIATYFGDAELEGEHADDRSATDEAISAAWEDSLLVWPEAPVSASEAEILGTVTVPMNDAAEVELLHLALEYSMDGGFEDIETELERHMLIRAFAEEDALVHATITCPAVTEHEIAPALDRLGLTDVSLEARSEPYPPSDAPRIVDGEPNTAYTIGFDDYFVRQPGPIWDMGPDESDLSIGPDWELVDAAREEPPIEFQHRDGACHLSLLSLIDRYTHESNDLFHDREATSAHAAERITDFPEIAAGTDGLEQLDDLLVPMETGQWMAMERYRLTYDADGEARERQMLIRVFQPTDRIVVANLDCAADSPVLADKTLEGLRLLTDTWADPQEFPEYP